LDISTLFVDVGCCNNSLYGARDVWILKGAVGMSRSQALEEIGIKMV